MPTPSILPSMLLPSLKTTISLLLPPVRFWILLNAKEVFSVPALLPVRFQVFSVLLPVRVLLPEPPSIVATVPPLRTKLSVLLPPTRFSKVLKVKEPLISPLLVPLIFQLLAELSPIKVLLPVVPPSALSILAIVPPTAVAVLFPKSTVTALL